MAPCRLVRACRLTLCQRLVGSRLSLRRQSALFMRASPFCRALCTRHQSPTIPSSSTTPPIVVDVVRCMLGPGQRRCSGASLRLSPFKDFSVLIKRDDLYIYQISSRACRSHLLCLGSVVPLGIYIIHTGYRVTGARVPCTLRRPAAGAESALTSDVAVEYLFWFFLSYVIALIERLEHTEIGTSKTRQGSGE